MIEIASDTVICGLSPSNMKTLTVTLLILDFHNQINSLNLLLYRTQRITEKYPINLNLEFLLIACSFFKWEDEKAHELNKESEKKSYMRRYMATLNQVEPQAKTSCSNFPTSS